MTFEEVVSVCFQTPELMAEYRRLSGSRLGLDERTGLDRAIDDATGHDPWAADWAPFFAFVRDVVWTPLAA